MSGDTETGRTAPVRVTALVHGDVQGVGFRWWTRHTARELGLVGVARNLVDGRVEVVAEGDRPACDALLEALNGRDAPGHVDHVVARWDDARGDLRDFRAE